MSYIHTTLPWRKITALTAACFSGLSAHAAITDWEFNKIIRYTQTADNQAPVAASGWEAQLFIEVDTAVDVDATAGTISGGGISGSLPLEWDDGEWLLEKEYVSKGALDAEFPSNNTYTLTLTGGALGTVTQTFTLGAEAYPNVPYFTGTVHSDLATIDAASPFDLTWGASGNCTEIILEISRDDPWLEFVDADLANTATNYTISANTLPTEDTVEGNLFFANFTNAPVGAGDFGTDGIAGNTTSLDFDVTTVISGPAPAVTSWELEKGALYEQDSEDTAPSSADRWFFFIEVETANANDATAATLTGSSITGSLSLTKEGATTWELDQEFASEALLNTAHPAGATYTIELSGGDLGTVTQNVTFSALSAPNVPYLVESGLSRVRSIDAAADFDFYWNDPGPNTTFIEIEFDSNDISVEANPSDDEMGTLDADTLSPGYHYSAELFFANEQNVSGSGGFGIDGLILASRITDLDIFTVLSCPVDAIVGAWQFGDGASNVSGILLFQADGSYFHAEDVIADGSEVDGIERGTYTWDAHSGLLTATPNTDTNGDLGLSAPEGAFTATVSSDTLTLSDTESTILTRVNDPADAIVGGWRICDNSNNDTGTLVFLSNGTYFHAEVNPDDGNGMERGTYAWNSGTETLTVNSTPVDTNSEIGLGGAGSLTVFNTGRKVLTIEETEDTHLYRVSNAAVLPNWRLNKSRDFTQTTDNTQPTTPTEWNIWGLVEVRNTNDATAVTLSGEDGSGTPFTVAYDEDAPGEWTLDPNSYATEALLNADYPNGETFTITVSGGELGTLTQDIQTSSSYPTIPYLTGTVLTDADDIDPTDTFDFTWNSHPSASVQLVITSQPDEEGDEYFEQTELILDLTSMTIPAGTLPAGGDAYGYLLFNTVTSDTNGIGGFGVAGFSANHSTLLDFSISARSTGEVLDDAFVDAGLNTPEDQALDATPHDDGVENLLKYAFNMDLSGPDSSTFEDGGDSGLPASGLEEVDGETVWQVEYVRPKGSGLVYAPKKAASLDQAFEPMVGAVSTQDLGNGLERVTVSEPCDPNTTPTCFSIVEVSVP